MKTLQHLTHHQLTERTIKLLSEFLNITALVGTLLFSTLPFILLIMRF